MYRIIISRIVWAFVLVLAQGLICNNINLLGYVTPSIPVCFFCLLPINTSRLVWLICGFSIGFSVDMFSETPGVTASSMTLAGLCAPFLLRLIIPKDNVDNLVPGIQTLGWGKFVCYVSLVVAIDRGGSILLEWCNYAHGLDMLFTFLGSSVLSIVLVLALKFFDKNF